MKHPGLLAVVVAMAAVTAGPVPAADPAAASDLHGYSVLRLHRGINPVDLGVAGRSGTVVIGHRENFNAHGFDIVTFYLTPISPSADPDNPWPRLDLVDFFDEVPHAGVTESQFLAVGGGADCVVHDFRLLRSGSGAPALVVVASRPVTHSYADPDPVTFQIYALTHNVHGDAGRPEYWFKLVKTQRAAKQYCDVGDAMSAELGLPDYRDPPVSR